MPSSSVDVRARQAPLRQAYSDDPGARRAPCACAAAPPTCPTRCTRTSRRTRCPAVVFRSGAHPAVGGDGDAPCSADVLLAALAACQEITTRMVAANMGIALEELEVTVEADWDPRGTLAMGREFPVGLTAIRAHTRVVIPADERGERAERLLRSAERYCVILSTLREGVPVESTISLETR